MGPVEGALENKFLKKLLGLENILGSLRKLLALVSNRAGIGILDPKEVSDESKRASLACIDRLVDSLITVEALSTSEDKSCVRKISRDGQ